MDRFDEAEARLGRTLPRAYREFIEINGSGPLPAPAGAYVELWAIGDVIELNEMREARDGPQEIVRFGGDGSREHLAFDYRTDPPRVVLLDVTAARDEVLIEQGSTFENFVSNARERGLNFGP